MKTYMPVSPASAVRQGQTDPRSTAAPPRDGRKILLNDKRSTR